MATEEERAATWRAALRRRLAFGRMLARTLTPVSQGPARELEAAWAPYRLALVEARADAAGLDGDEAVV